MVRRFGRALCLRSPARQSLRKRLEPARTVPDGPVAALMIPATLNRRAAPTGVVEDARKAPETAPVKAEAPVWGTGQMGS